MAKRITGSTPKLDGYRMPAEFEPQAGVWMLWPERNDNWRDGAKPAQKAFLDVATAILQFEPVTVCVSPAQYQNARERLPRAVRVVEMASNDAWIRDCGPTFLVNGNGGVRAVDWTFNAWGGLVDGLYFPWDLDDQVAQKVCELERVDSYRAEGFVLEGGSIHVDGEGTVLLTDAVQLDPRRNPDADRARVEAELARTLGTTTAIWLPRGLTRDYDEFGTNGHVDIVATLASPGRLLLHDQRDPAHPDHAVTRELRELLAAQTDAAGRRLEIIDLPAPTTLRDDEGFVDWSYVNHLVTNEGVVACGFGDEKADAEARAILAEVYPGRRVVTVDARPLFDRGGGIHCITQQQPLLEVSA